MHPSLFTSLHFMLQGLEVLNRVVGIHSGDAWVLEQALGLLAALTLRNPSAAERATELGCIDVVLEVRTAVRARGDSAPSICDWPPLSLFRRTPQSCVSSLAAAAGAGNQCSQPSMGCRVALPEMVGLRACRGKRE
jgi:hypothetical protein